MLPQPRVVGEELLGDDEVRVGAKHLGEVLLREWRTRDRGRVMLAFPSTAKKILDVVRFGEVLVSLVVRRFARDWVGLGIMSLLDKVTCTTTRTRTCSPF